VAANDGADPRARRTRLRDIVPRDLLYCLETTDLAEAVALMREHQVEWIPVLGIDRRPVGLLALADLPEESTSTNGA
jgi:CBS domain-containing protein